MNVLGLLGVIFLISFMIEALIEYLLGQPMSKSPKLAPYSWILVYVSAAVSVAAAIHYQLDLVHLLAVELDPKTTIQPGLFGFLLTGLTIGRGSNALHDLLMRFFVQKNIPGQVERQLQAMARTQNLKYPINRP